MGLFGDSKTDTSQNSQIATLQKQLNDIANNCNTWWTYFNKTFFPQYNALVKSLNDIAQRVVAGEKLDAQQQAALNGLVKTAVSIQQASQETAKE